MARFNVYASASGAPYLLDVQADLLDHLSTRVVVPYRNAADTTTPCGTSITVPPVSVARRPNQSPTV